MSLTAMTSEDGERGRIVTLNVGGTVFTTSSSTLRKYPESMLARMFSSGMSPSDKDAQGNRFIDRDGSMFEYILACLRDGDTAILPQDIDILLKLRNEVDFFG